MRSEADTREKQLPGPTPSARQWSPSVVHCKCHSKQDEDPAFMGRSAQWRSKINYRAKSAIDKMSKGGECGDWARGKTVVLAGHPRRPPQEVATRIDVSSSCVSFAS